MRVAYLISTLLAATALSSAVPQTPAEDAELIPIDDTFGNIAEPRDLYIAILTRLLDSAGDGSAPFASEDDQDDNSLVVDDNEGNQAWYSC